MKEQQTGRASAVFEDTSTVVGKSIWNAVDGLGSSLTASLPQHASKRADLQGLSKSTHAILSHAIFTYSETRRALTIKGKAGSVEVAVAGEELQRDGKPLMWPCQAPGGLWPAVEAELRRVRAEERLAAHRDRTSQASAYSTTVYKVRRYRR